jgi:hypothetical protein
MVHLVALVRTTPSSQERSLPDAANKTSGRWTVVPAANGPTVVAGTTYFFAWRLDTQTGNLELCTYDPGGWKNAVTGYIASESLNCTLPAKGNPLE